ncbi:MAG: type II toxin-antitoxin system HicB family antitoxin [Oscillospiraceae bacterium]|nr:type II toxin-antitoxin system HicB family antitoxin [Oscillospiraceae bacterium]
MKIKYAYPAVFEKEENGYFVNFPDISPCYTEGSTLEEAVFMAKDVLEGRIEVALDRGENLPVPSNLENLKGKVMLIIADVDNKENQTKFVKKTVSIPQWLNDEAKKANINFSVVFREALQERLNLNQQGK